MVKKDRFKLTKIIRKMKLSVKKTIMLLFSFSITAVIVSAQIFEWRGPGRTGVYNETGLLKKWPEAGPKLIWEFGNSGIGYSSATVTDDAIYVTGRKESNDVMTALTLDGKKKWEVVYGKAWTVNHDGTRCTPTFYNGRIFLISGSGDIVCVGTDGKIKWSKNHYSLYDSKPLMFGISESPLAFDNMVIASPGGKKASVVALSTDDGKILWEAEPVDTSPQYVNPMVIEYAGKKIIITVMATYILAINATDGRILVRGRAVAIRAVDATGAGDAFIAGFLDA
jgi:hypothetical protein